MTKKCYLSLKLARDSSLQSDKHYQKTFKLPAPDQQSMTGKCPGQGRVWRDPKRFAYEVDCPNCESKVEFFYDDTRRKCGNCDESVQPDIDTLRYHHGCASTCKSARECLGDEKYLKLLLTEPVTKQAGEKTIEGIVSKVSDEEISTTLGELMQSNLPSGYLLDLDSDLEYLCSADRESIMAALTKFFLV